MSDQFVGEIRWFPYTRGVPEGWQSCDGSLLSISNNEILFVVIGTSYGGDGVNSFAVPDLRGRLPLHQGQGSATSPRVIGQSFGAERVTLLPSQLGGHTHTLAASTTTATTTSSDQAVVAVAVDTLYVSSTAGATPSQILASAVKVTGGGVAHENRAPTLPIHAAIATVGVFAPPS